MNDAAPRPNIKRSKQLLCIGLFGTIKNHRYRKADEWSDRCCQSQGISFSSFDESPTLKQHIRLAIELQEKRDVQNIYVRLAGFQYFIPTKNGHFSFLIRRIKIASITMQKPRVAYSFTLVVAQQRSSLKCILPKSHHTKGQSVIQVYVHNYNCVLRGEEL
jgi:hypothetical protein